MPDLNRAIELYREKPAAEDSFERGSNTSDFSTRGSALFNTGHYEAALADYEQAVKGGSPFQTEIVDCLIQLKRWKEAKEALDKFLAPDDATVPHDGPFFIRVPISSMGTDAGNPKSQEDVPNYDALWQRAVVHIRLKEYGEAEADVAAAIKMRPDDARAYGTASWTRLFTHHFAEARDAALRGLNCDKTQTWIRANLAHAYLLDGHFDWARSLYLSEKDKTPEAARTHLQSILKEYADLRAAGVGVNFSDMDRMETLLRATLDPSGSRQTDASPIHHQGVDE